MSTKKAFHLFLFATISFLGLGSFPLQAQQQETNPTNVQVKIEVKGLSCPFCAYGLEKRLRELPAVQSLDILLKEGVALLKFPEDKQPTEQELRKAVEQAGFETGRIISCPVGKTCEF